MVFGLNIHEENKENLVVLRLEGRVDATSSPLLERKIASVIELGVKKILMDFSKVDYLSSAGLRLMLSGTKKLKTQEGRLVFSGINDEVMEIIKMAGFEKILDLFSTEREAVKALKS